MIYEIINEIVVMFIEMSPYIVLGLFFVGLLNFYFNKKLIIKHTGKNDFLSILKASLFGIPLPLCSCGVIPTSVYIAKNGASKSSTVSFLTSTPQTGIDSIIATYGMMGYVFAIYRPFAALIMGIVSGLAVKLFDKEAENKFINLDDKENCSDCNCNDDKSNKSFTDSHSQNDYANEEDSNTEENLTFKEKLKKNARYAFVEFLDDISIQFIVGVIIAGLITYFIPEELIAQYNIESGLIAMLIVVVIAMPMYVCATASIPIAVALMMKGFSPGVAFVFIAAGPAINAATLSIIIKVLGKKITTVFVLSLIISSILMGYLLDFIFNVFDLEIDLMIMHNHQSDGFFEYFKIFISIIFFIMLVFSIKRKYFAKLFKVKEKKMDYKVYRIKGMTCNHCVNNVKETLLSIDGIEDAIVDLSDNTASVKGEHNSEDIKNKISSIGYEVVD